MICPECNAEYRQGFYRCADCDVELVESLGEAVRVETPPPEKYGALLWRGENPHSYINLLGWLGREVNCYGRPAGEMPPSSDRDFRGESETRGFEVWVSEADLARARWLQEAVSKTHEENPPEDREATKLVAKKSEPGAPIGVCPLCLGEFASASSLCPNCNVPLHAGAISEEEDAGGRLLCDFWHPQFGVELRQALQAAGIAFNNANYSSSDILTGRSYVPNYEVIVLDADFERATQAMARVLQHCEFEPAAGFGPRRRIEKTFWPGRAEENSWQIEDLGFLLWAGANLGAANGIGLALREHHVPYRVDDSEQGTSKIFIHPEDEADGREIVAQVVEGVPPE